jgi:hypothetical protein
MWLNLVERVLWEHQVAGSNPVIPILFNVACGVAVLALLLVTESGRVRTPSSNPFWVNLISREPPYSPPEGWGRLVLRRRG